MFLKNRNPPTKLQPRMADPLAADARVKTGFGHVVKSHILSDRGSSKSRNPPAPPLRRFTRRTVRPAALMTKTKVTRRKREFPHSPKFFGKNCKSVCRPEIGHIHPKSANLSQNRRLRRPHNRRREIGYPRSKNLPRIRAPAPF